MLRRKELVKDVKKKGENAKVAVRNIRRDAMDAIKKKGKEDGISEDEIKEYQDDVQKSTDKYVAKIDAAVEEKIKGNINSIIADVNKSLAKTISY